MIAGHIRPDQRIGTEDMVQIIVQGRITMVMDTEKILEENTGRIVEKDIEMKEVIAMIDLVIEIGQETEILQGVMVGTGVLIAADPDQDPE